MPNESDEALRDLVRAHEDAVEVTREAKQRLKAFVIRHGLRYGGRAGRTIPYRRWLAGVTMPDPAPVAMTEQFLHSADVVTVLEQVSCKRVAFMSSAT